VMTRTKGQYDYEKRMYNDLGVNFSHYRQKLVPQIRAMKGNACELCKGTKDLHVHHSDMDNININTLKLLCRKCHVKEHMKLKLK